MNTKLAKVKLMMVVFIVVFAFSNSLAQIKIPKIPKIPIDIPIEKEEGKKEEKKEEKREEKTGEKTGGITQGKSTKTNIKLDITSGSYEVSQDDILGFMNTIKLEELWNDVEKSDKVGFIVGSIYAYDWYKENPDAWKGDSFCYYPKDEDARVLAGEAFWIVIAQGASRQRNNASGEIKKIWEDILNEKNFKRTSLLIKTYIDKPENNKNVIRNIFKLTHDMYGHPESKFLFFSHYDIKNKARKGFYDEFVKKIEEKDTNALNAMLHDLGPLMSAIITNFYEGLCAENKLWKPIFETYGRGFIMASVNPNSEASTVENMKKFFVYTYKMDEKKFDEMMKDIANDPQGQMGFLLIQGVGGNSSDIAMSKIISTLENLKVGSRKNSNFLLAVKKLAGDMNYPPIDYNLRVWWQSQGLREKTYAEIGLGIAESLKLDHCEDEALKVLSSDDHNTRIASCNYLSKFGTKKAISLLSKVASTDPYYIINYGQKVFPVRNKAEIAVENIKLRDK